MTTSPWLPAHLIKKAQLATLPPGSMIIRPSDTPGPLELALTFSVGGEAAEDNLVGAYCVTAWRDKGLAPGSVMWPGANQTFAAISSRDLEWTVEVGVGEYHPQREIGMVSLPEGILCGADSQNSLNRSPVLISLSAWSELKGTIPRGAWTNDWRLVSWYRDRQIIIPRQT